jgi:hypothetical protein
MNRIARQAVPLTLVAGAIIALPAIALPAVAQADSPPACASGQVQVSNGGEQAAAGHRRVLLAFSLAPGAAPCTLTGYPAVNSGAGGPLLHADWTLFGYMGGARTETPPTVTVSPSQPAYAVVEGAAIDAADPNRKCPTYTDLQVIPPDTTDAFTVPAAIDTCGLQVHPVNAEQ